MTKQFLAALCAIALAACGPSAHAQGNTRINDQNTIGWYNTIATLKFSGRWSGHLEYQWRRDHLITDWQQSLLRVGTNYQIHPRVQLRVGYAWAETFPYGEYPLQTTGRQFPEHRTFQMATINDDIGRLELSHRFVLEQRWVGRYTTPTAPRADDYIFSNRARYMLRMQAPLNRKKMEDKTLYAAAYDEVMISFGHNVRENVFDQNRIGLLLGYRFNKVFRVEAGHLQQFVQLGREVGGNNVFQYNSGLIVNAYVNVDLSKRR